MNDVCKRNVPIPARKVTAAVSTVVLLFVPSDDGCLHSSLVRVAQNSSDTYLAVITLPNCRAPRSRIVKGELLGTNSENRRNVSCT